MRGFGKLDRCVHSRVTKCEANTVQHAMSQRKFLYQYAIQACIALVSEGLTDMLADLSSADLSSADLSSAAWK